MMLAQALVMKLFHRMVPEGKIGPALNLTAMYPATCSPEDSIAAHNWEVLRCWNFADVPVFGTYHPLAWSYLCDRGIAPEIKSGDMEILKGASPDFIAMNYYSTATIAASRGDTSDVAARAGDQQIMLGEQGVYRPAENPHVGKTEYGWVVDPVGFRYTLRKVYERYHLPILITENGIGAPDRLEDDGSIHDTYRIDFIRDHLRQMQLAITDGVEMIGYCPWAAIDVVSTHQGYRKRYGFIYVDRDEFDLKELKRYKKDSFCWYQKAVWQQGVAEIHQHGERVVLRAVRTWGRSQAGSIGEKIGRKKNVSLNLSSSLTLSALCLYGNCPLSVFKLQKRGNKR